MPTSALRGSEASRSHGRAQRWQGVGLAGVIAVAVALFVATLWLGEVWPGLAGAAPGF